MHTFIFYYFKFFKKEIAKSEERVAKTRAARQIRLDDLKAVFGNPAGARVLKWLFELCWEGESIFTASSEIYNRSGKQEVGLILRHDILEADHEIYFKYLKQKTQEIILEQEGRKQP